MSAPVAARTIPCPRRDRAQLRLFLVPPPAVLIYPRDICSPGRTNPRARGTPLRQLDIATPSRQPTTPSWAHDSPLRQKLPCLLTLAPPRAAIRKNPASRFRLLHFQDKAPAGWHHLPRLRRIRSQRSQPARAHCVPPPISQPAFY